MTIDEAIKVLRQHNVTNMSVLRITRGQALEKDLLAQVLDSCEQLISEKAEYKRLLKEAVSIINNSFPEVGSCWGCANYDKVNDECKGDYLRNVLRCASGNTQTKPSHLSGRTVMQMAEYINRKILIDLVLSKLKFIGDARIMNQNDEKVLSEIDGYEKAIDAVHELILDKDLIENVQAVKYGRWIGIYEWAKMHDSRPSGMCTYFWCSECQTAQGKKSNFCPNCGAKMDESEDDKHE